MKLWGSPKKLFKAVVPDLQKFVGRTVVINDKPIVIETLRGNLGMSLGTEKAKPQFYEINGEHLMGMLRFHAQMENDKSITEQQFKDFENIEFEAEKHPDKKMPGEL